MNKAKPFDIPKREVWEAFKRVKANQGAAGVDGQSIQEFETQLAGISISSGTGCRRAVTCRHRCAEWTSLKRMVGRDRWVFPRSRTALHRRLFVDTWSPYWSRSFMRTLMGIDQGVLRSMRFGQRVSDVGATTGSWTSTSKGSSTASIGTLTQCSAQAQAVLVGVALHRTLAEDSCDAGRWQTGARGIRERRRVES